MNTSIKGLYFLRLAAWLLLLAPLASACKSDTAYTKTIRKHVTDQKVLDETTIQKYLTTNKITNYKRTDSGLYIVSTGTDGTGDLIKAGQKAQVKYIGKVLSTGYVFDSSYDNRTPCQCIEVLVGAGQVIAGWDEGLLLMKKGDQKTLIIPSNLAYGFLGDGSHNPPAAIGNDQVLIFDMNITNVQ